MLTLRKYNKHIRTLIDEITHTYFYLMKDLKPEVPDLDDFTMFSGYVRELEDNSHDILDFCVNLRKSLDVLRPFDSSKEKILLRKLDNLYDYEIFARKELN